MSEVFISYAKENEQIAQFVYSHLQNENISAFLASISLKPGSNWEPKIRENLRQASWVFFLASKIACTSLFVQQELGGAWLANKNIVPIVWDLPPDELPGFLKKYQALDLRGSTYEVLKSHVVNIARRIKADKATGWLVAGLVGAAILLLFSE